MRILTKLKLIILGAALVPPMVILFAYGEIGNKLFAQAVALGMGLALLTGLISPGLMNQWLFTRQLEQIQKFCERVKHGEYGRSLDVPNEGSSGADENELVSLMRSMNWMAHRIKLREDQLRDTIMQLNDAQIQLINQKQALENMNVRLTEMAMTDPLTGISNRRHFFDHVEQELYRNVGPISMLLVDIDYFKKINDQFGHQTGDMVLVEFARILSAAARKSDIVARIGGEEFGFLLTDTDRKLAVELASAAHQAVQKHVFDDGSGNAISVTCSIGVCTVYRPPYPKSELLYRFADTALYAAKSYSRNCIFSYNINKDAVEQIEQVPA